MLTASMCYSQDTSDQETIEITVGEAKEAIKKFQRLEQLEVAIKAQGLVISKLQIQVEDLKKINQMQKAENALLEKSNRILTTQLGAEKAKKPKFSTWEKIGTGVGAFLLGVLVGKL